MKKITIAAFGLVLLQSCISVYGLTDDYGKLDKKQQAMVTGLKDFNTSEAGKIYKINGKELRTELAKHPKSLVYVFVNGCSSEHCKPLVVYENYAKKHDMKLFLVMVGFGYLDATLDMPHPEPLYAIDGEYYQCTYPGKYSNRFENDMKGKPTKQKNKNWEGSLYFFNYDQLEKTLLDLPNS